MDSRQALSRIVGEVQQALVAVGEAQVGSFCDLLVGARAIFAAGEGRSGLVGRCFAMRLVHLGLPAYVVGETVTPHLERGDILVAVSGTGETAKTRAVARLAAEAGGTVVAVTAAEGSALASMASLVLRIPAGPPARSEQYGGSLFEQSSLIALDAVALILQHRLGITAESMDRRHANLE